MAAAYPPPCSGCQDCRGAPQPPLAPHPPPRGGRCPPFAASAHRDCRAPDQALRGAAGGPQDAPGGAGSARRRRRRT
eukprot:7289589-Alexandrium_andersonii.AAC.1